MRIAQCMGLSRIGVRAPCFYLLPRPITTPSSHSFCPLFQTSQPFSPHSPNPPMARPPMPLVLAPMGMLPLAIASLGHCATKARSIRSAQRSAAAVVRDGGAPRGTQLLAKLGGRGSHPANAERDLHRYVQREFGPYPQPAFAQTLDAFTRAIAVVKHAMASKRLRSLAIWRLRLLAIRCFNCNRAARDWFACDCHPLQVCSAILGNRCD